MKAPKYLAIWQGSVYWVIGFKKAEGKVELRPVAAKTGQICPLVEAVTIYKRAYKASEHQHTLEGTRNE